MELGASYAAKFMPARTDTLKASAARFIGREGIFEAMWLIGEGPYTGQWAMRVPDDWKEELHGAPSGHLFAWVPSGDLVITGTPTR